MKKKMIIWATVIIILLIALFFIWSHVRNTKPVAPPPPPPKPKPVYEKDIGDIRFKLVQAVDLGNTLKASDSFLKGYKNNVTTTEKFIKVVVSAQNIGKKEISSNSWGVGNIIDSDGRIFSPLEYWKQKPWLPPDNQCGTKLKPGFTPKLCTQIYEVAKISKKLKIEIFNKAERRTPKGKSQKLDIRFATSTLPSGQEATSTTSTETQATNTISVDSTSTQ